MFNLEVEGKLIGSFLLFSDCWKPLDALYQALPDQFSDSIDWKIIDSDNGNFIDGRGEYEGEFQHPNGLPAGLWYALAEDASAFKTIYYDLS